MHPAAPSLSTLQDTLWKAADKLRNNLDAAEYKHVVLGLIFLKYISDFFAELRDQFAESDRLQRAVRENLRSLGYEI